MRFVLFFVGLLAGNAARVDVGTKERAKEVHEHEQEQEVRFQRLRAFDGSGVQMLLDGMDLPLVVSDSDSSFLEQNVSDFLLPSPWDRKLKAVAVLGRGTFGKVFKCKVLCTRQDVYVSVKLIRHKSSMVTREIEMLDQMKGLSDFCITSIGSPSYLDTPEGYWLMMPLMNAGELFDFIQQCTEESVCGRCSTNNGRRCWSALNPAYTDGYILALFHDIVTGVEALHKQGMLHTDLKPQNVMLNCKEGTNCFAAVIDLGLLCKPSDPTDCGRQGTPGFMPPEVIQAAKARRLGSRDVWALGVILYQMLYQKPPPFYGDGRGDKVILYNPETDRNIPNPREKADDLVVQMLSHYASRPAPAQILKSLKDIILELDDATAYTMIVATPAERHAASETPTCLDEKYEAPVVPTAQTTRPTTRRTTRRATTSPPPAPAPPEFYTGDIGYKKLSRKYCMDKPIEEDDEDEVYCGYKYDDGSKCCHCTVKRHGQLRREFLKMDGSCH